MKTFKWASLILILGVMVSCYPEKDRTIEDYDIVGTKFAEVVDFKDYQTFYLYDSLVVVYDTTGDKPDYPEQEANLTISTIRDNMIDYGWTEVTVRDSADVYIEASTWNSTVYGAIYYPGWGYWWGYPGYPGYPGWGASYYSYTTGTLMMHMLDVKNYPGDDSPPKILWNGGLNGLLNSQSTLDRIEFSINQAFTQSPYLKK
ncbi:MAG: DUF4136 domain-containing protein [Salibacteraceae bacterium]